MKRKIKKRPGRHSAVGGRVKLTTTLAPATVKWLRVLGVGNIARAIEGLVEYELSIKGEFWEDTAKEHGWWDASMKLPKQKPVNQFGDK